MKAAGEKKTPAGGGAAAGKKEQGPGKAGAARAEAPKLRSRAFVRLAALLVLLISIAAVVERGGAVEWLFAAVAVLAAGGGLIMPYAAVGRITAERVVQESDLVDGGSAHVTLTLKLSRMLPFMWVSIREELVNQSAAAQSGAVTIEGALLPGINRQLSIDYRVNGLQRGEYAFHAITVRTGDMLGLTVRTFKLTCPGTLLVMPQPPKGEQLEELPGFQAGRNRNGVQPVLSFGGQMASAASRLRRDGAGSELRTYVPGDPLRRVDWRAMARGQGMLTRTGEAAEAGTILLVLETSLQVYGQNQRLFDAHAGRAAAIMKKAEREAKRVIVLTNSPEAAEIHTGGRGSSELREAEVRLAKLRLGAAKPMSQCLSDVVAGAPRGAVVICMTTGHADHDGAQAGESEAPENLRYGAKLAGVRGVRLLLLLSAAETGSRAAEASWLKQLQGTGCQVKALQVPDSYRSVRPRAAEISMRAAKEGGVNYVETANDGRSW
ncbi:DUF58 domain-containing protein [Paenibacillus sp. R14(2021)]|uniref:DUF58 domain-containing protein n=1 Tax=Paenibacillus sp. R14(2021) TaxID=2859228 RepID=UPI001C6115CA|nr:DUF58 domain-containing protein [Paenibacillus sp. R14(2021)]